MAMPRSYGKRSGMPRAKRGHTAHTRMGLSRGNPMSGGGNFGRGRRRGRTAVSRSRRRY